QKSSHELFVHPGDTSPTTVKLSLLEIATISAIDANIPAEMLISCPDSDGVILRLESSKGVLFDGQVMPGRLQHVEISPSEWLLISVGPLQNSHCDHLTLDFSFAK